MTYEQQDPAYVRRGRAIAALCAAYNSRDCSSPIPWCIGTHPQPLKTYATTPRLQEWYEKKITVARVTCNFPSGNVVRVYLECPNPPLHPHSDADIPEMWAILRIETRTLTGHKSSPKQQRIFECQMLLDLAHNLGLQAQDLACTISSPGSKATEHGQRQQTIYRFYNNNTATVIYSHKRLGNRLFRLPVLPAGCHYLETTPT